MPETTYARQQIDRLMEIIRQLQLEVIQLKTQLKEVKKEQINA